MKLQGLIILRGMAKESEMAKNPGKRFESDFIKSIPERCDITRLKDAGGWSNATNMRFTSSNPCDFIVYSDSEWGSGNGTMYKFELKSTLGKSLPFGNIKAKNDKLTAKEASLKFIKKLEESESKGVWAGFVVNFRATNQTFRVLASDIACFMVCTDRESIPLSWFEENAILIKQTLVRVRYKYDLEFL